MSPLPAAVPLLEIRNLHVSFRTHGRHMTEVVHGLSFSVAPRSTVALVGESGSGKSVSALAVMGLLPEESSAVDAASSIRYDGRELLALDRAERRALCGHEIAMIFQDPMSSLNPVLTVGTQIGEVLRLHLGMSRAQARQRTLELLEEVGIADAAHKIDSYPGQMSGGQQQRVMIAMAIACEPRLLIADEPTTALDVTIQQQIIELLARLQQRREMAVLFITHDLGLVAQIADTVVVMRHGHVRETGPAMAVLQQPQDEYTRALLRCRPVLGQRPARLPVIGDQLLQSDLIVVPDLPAAVTDAPPLLVVHHLSKHYQLRDGWWRQREFRAVDDVSFTLARGQTLGVVGESGSGKTTVGLMLLRLLQASSGSVLFDGRDLLALTAREFQPYKRRIHIVFQNPYASLNPRFTVGQILLEPLRIHGIGDSEAARLAMAASLLDKVGLPASALQRYPHEFSGGQRQRIAIARCLTLQPEILVCDESVSALDVSVQAQVLNLLKDLQQELGLSYLFISHDLAVVQYMSDQVMVMQQGRVVELAPADQLYRQPQHPYTRALLAAIPGHASR
ncbi:dipeptide ABC transporter ATP-binding protein [Pseudoduganella sp. FT93W]|uniref:Dipeptide ABC transporter ATP-binding protein n=1 Tax=Duganella fentianensis TaxID=2692177 RepID=A0A845I0H4_9BURK|nr:ABC transporter ATP-binding protein [Duganella fentianensis]MYN47114.1 dipeptide ABC transporter ATP-binding protein [Duganella fentianensis]